MQFGIRFDNCYSVFAHPYKSHTKMNTTIYLWLLGKILHISHHIQLALYSLRCFCTNKTRSINQSILHSKTILLFRMLSDYTVLLWLRIQNNQRYKKKPWNKSIYRTFVTHLSAMLLLLDFFDATHFHSASTLYFFTRMCILVRRNNVATFLCTSWHVGKAWAVNNELSTLSFRAGRLTSLLRSDSFFLKYGNLVPCLSCWLQKYVAQQNRDRWLLSFHWRSILAVTLQASLF